MFLQEHRHGAISQGTLLMPALSLQSSILSEPVQVLPCVS
jgi:hypothetical protein